MLDFDEEARRILESERERIEADAKYGAGWVILVTGLLWLALLVLLVLHAAQSVLHGVSFPWRELWSDIGGFAAFFAMAWIYYRLNSSQKARDARLARIELKLDRLLEKTPVRLKGHISEECESVRGEIRYRRAEDRAGLLAGLKAAVRRTDERQ